MRKISITRYSLLLLLIYLLFTSSCSQASPSASSSPALGLFGTLNDDIGHNTEYYVNIFASSSFDWHWTYYEHTWREYGYELYADILNDAGKRVILCTEFWSAIAIPPNQNNWTDLYNDLHNGGEMYATALAEIIAQINWAGVDNLYAITIGSEEPAAGYWFQEDALNVEHFTEVYNKLYDDVKAEFPNLKIFASITIDTFSIFCPLVLTDEQIDAIKKDGLETHVYWSDLNFVEEFYTRVAGFRSDVGDEIYTLIWCSTPSPNEEQSKTPDWTRACFELAKSAGIPNIGFYAQHRSNGSRKWLFFNGFDPDLELDDVHNPYGFREVLLDIVGN